MTQYGFYVDADHCTGCRTCVLACKDVNRLEVGENFRKVHSYCGGDFPDVFMYHVSMACNHCTEPLCVKSCPTGAMYKDEETGLVLHDDEACIGCETCVKSCPYDAPTLIPSLGIVRKCDGCAGLRVLGEQPSCVASCSMRAIEFGDVDELRAAHSDQELVCDFPAIPGSDATGPNVLYNIKECMNQADFIPAVL